MHDSNRDQPQPVHLHRQIHSCVLSSTRTYMKTILVLIMGFFFFGKEGLNLHVVLGMIIAVFGMVWYSNASTKPGGKERRSSLPTTRQQKHGNLGKSDEHDGKV